MFPPVRFLISINRNEFKQNALCKAISDVHVHLGSCNGQTGGFDGIENCPMISLSRQIVSKVICRNCYPHTVSGVTLPGLFWLTTERRIGQAWTESVCAD